MTPLDSGGPGGRLYMEYMHAEAGERHALRLMIAPFTPTPSGAQHDYLYTGAGPYAPSESGVLATFAAIGALWQAYFPAAWSLALVEVGLNNLGELDNLLPLPVVTPIVGAASDATYPDAVVKRKFFVSTARGDRRRIYFSQVAGEVEDEARTVTPSSGGLDARDRAWMAYLSGPDTAVRGLDGLPFGPQATVRAIFARRLIPPPSGGGDGRDTWVGPTPPSGPQDGWLWVDTALHGPPYQLKVYRVSLAAWVDVGLSVDEDAPPGVDGGGSVLTDCLTFPLLARICNTPEGQIHYHTPESEHVQDATGYVIPGGHRLERLAG